MVTNIRKRSIPIFTYTKVFWANNPIRKPYINNKLFSQSRYRKVAIHGDGIDSKEAFKSVAFSYVPFWKEGDSAYPQESMAICGYLPEHGQWDRMIPAWLISPSL